MLIAINTVRGAVATKDIIPVLTHIMAADGRLQGSNGRITIDSPCGQLKGYNFIVPCAPFLKAVDACMGEPLLTVKEDKSSLTVKRGAFKATLPCDTSGNFPHQAPAGRQTTGISGDLLGVLRILRPFISVDASRPWATGVLLKNGAAYATNNIVVAKMPAPSLDIPLNLPGALVDELLRLNMELSSVLADENQITFQFANGSWLKGSLLSSEWPDVDRMLTGKPTMEVPKGLLQAVEQIAPFCADAKQPYIHAGGFGIQTSDGDKSACCDAFRLPESVFRAEPLTDVLRVATHMDMTTYPAPCSFVGDKGLVGLIIGVKI